MAKRKTPQAGARAKTPGESQVATPAKINWHQERFIEAYIDNGGNGTRAYMAIYRVDETVAGVNAARLLADARISGAVAARREQIREQLNFTREKYLKILTGMALATTDDFTRVLKDPTKKSNYRGLGDLRYAIKEASMGEKTNTIRLNDRKAALDDLNKILGFDQPSDSGSGESLFGGVRDSVSKLRSGKKAG